jgi:secreted trypsin-like serine protease
MRKILLALVAIVSTSAAALTLASPAGAITGNFVEDEEHPYVGLIAFYDASGEFTHRCSGSLITDTVVLTAGHCTDANTGAVSAVMWFQQDAGADFDAETGAPATSGYPEGCAEGTLGEMCATSTQLFNYGFDDFATFPDTHDAGLLVLDQSIDVGEYGQLAEAGTLDALATRRGQQKATFTASGYGLTETNPVHTVSFRERLMAEATLTNLRSHNTDGFNLQTNGNGKGKGGTCSGDSGGPVFLGPTTSDVIVAVTSFGMNAWCRGTDFSYRTDRTEVLDWIKGIIGEDEFGEITFA